MSAKTKRTLRKGLYLDKKDAYACIWKSIVKVIERESQKQYYEQNKDGMKLRVRKHYEQNKYAKNWGYDSIMNRIKMLKIECTTGLWTE